MKPGSHREALAAGEQAVALIAQELGADNQDVGAYAYATGVSAEAVGDLAEARRLYAEALRIGEIVHGPDNAMLTSALERLGFVVLKTGAPAEAEAIFLRELKIWRDTLGENSALAGPYSGLGAVNLARGNYSAAYTHYRRAVQLLVSEDGGPAWSRSVHEKDVIRHRDTFIGLGRAAAGLRGQMGVDQPALMDESFAAGQRAWATSASSALAKMTARLKAGETELGRAVRQLDMLNDRILALHGQDHDADSEWYKVQRADAAYQKAQFTWHTAVDAYHRENPPVEERQIELAARLNDIRKRCPNGARQQGCEAIESERGAIRKEVDELNKLAQRGAEELRLLGEKMTAAEQQLPGYAQYHSTREALLAEAQRLEDQLEAERAHMVKRFPDYLSLAEPAPLTVAETQKLLKDDEALAAILTGPESSLVWVVTPGGADWAEIGAGEAALATEVKALRAGLAPAAEGGGASFDVARAHQLYQLLLGRFSSVLSGKRHVMFVATGPVSSLPFQVLVTEPPRPGLSEAEALKEAQWLIRRHALSVLPSVQSLSALRKLAASGIAAKPYFGIGDPVLGDPDAGAGNARGKAKPKVTVAELYRNGGTADLPLLQTLAPLPETAEELRRVAQTLGAGEESIAVRQAATKDRLLTTPLRDYRILHFATHGLVAGDLSGLYEPALVLSLPPRSTNVEDALLTASEVATLQLNADWAVLSACNTASGDKVGADALSGLARAFFFAGTRALLVSHWAVNSEAAVALTTRTFALLANEPRLRRAEAFQQAMLTLIAEGHSPSYWAPFVIVGEGGAVLRQRGQEATGP